MKGKSVLFCIFFILCTVCAQAVPARPGYYKLIQPDGSSINARLTGDEFYKLLTTETGSAIIKDRDGWYSYACFTEDGRDIAAEFTLATDPPLLPPRHETFLTL